MMQKKSTAETITVQYEFTTARRGKIVWAVTQRTFRSEAALAKWQARAVGNVKIIRRTPAASAAPDDRADSIYDYTDPSDRERRS